ncbi:MAG TPA: hypothetical protein VIR58_06400 [Acidimicrobiales bacterium]
MPADHADEPLRAGVEHLQAAAREMIAASRSLLDAAEELVEDPKAVQSMVASLGALATAAAAKLRSDAAACGGSGEPGDDDRESGVERIHLS